MKKTLLLALVLGLFISCSEKKKDNKKEEIKKPVLSELQIKAKGIFGTLPLVAETKENPITVEKVALGKALYFDTILSKNKTQSCNTCHNLDTYGVDNLPVSPGDKKGTFGDRNSPTTLNAALHTTQFWDGREPHVEAQAGGPILNPVEMGMASEKEVVNRLSEESKYQELFSKAFPNDKEAITYENLKKAIGAFERKLITPAPFDAYLAGDEKALNDLEKEGLALFIDKACIACHSGPALGGNIFQKFGVFTDYWKLTHSGIIDKGRFNVTNKEEDLYVFKSPSLRNIEKTYPYFHDGSVVDLSEAIKIMGKAQLNIDFTDSEVKALVAYLNSLTGEVAQEFKI